MSLRPLAAQPSAREVSDALDRALRANGTLAYEEALVVVERDLCLQKQTRDVNTSVARKLRHRTRTPQRPRPRIHAPPYGNPTPARLRVQQQHYTTVQMRGRNVFPFVPQESNSSSQLLAGAELLSFRTRHVAEVEDDELTERQVDWSSLDAAHALHDAAEAVDAASVTQTRAQPRGSSLDLARALLEADEASTVRVAGRTEESRTAAMAQALAEAEELLDSETAVNDMLASGSLSMQPHSVADNDHANLHIERALSHVDQSQVNDVARQRMCIARAAGTAAARNVRSFMSTGMRYVGGHRLVAPSRRPYRTEKHGARRSRASRVASNVAHHSVAWAQSHGGFRWGGSTNAREMSTSAQLFGAPEPTRDGRHAQQAKVFVARAKGERAFLGELSADERALRLRTFAPPKDEASLDVVPGEQTRDDARKEIACRGCYRAQAQSFIANAAAERAARTGAAAPVDQEPAQCTKPLPNRALAATVVFQEAPLNSSSIAHSAHAAKGACTKERAQLDEAVHVKQAVAEAKQKRMHVAQKATLAASEASHVIAMAQREERAAGKEDRHAVEIEDQGKASVQRLRAAHAKELQCYVADANEARELHCDALARAEAAEKKQLVLRAKHARALLSMEEAHRKVLADQRAAQSNAVGAHVLRQARLEQELLAVRSEAAEHQATAEALRKSPGVLPPTPSPPEIDIEVRTGGLPSPSKTSPPPPPPPPPPPELGVLLPPPPKHPRRWAVDWDGRRRLPLAKSSATTDGAIVSAESQATAHAGGGAGDRKKAFFNVAKAEKDAAIEASRALRETKMQAMSEEQRAEFVAAEEDAKAHEVQQKKHLLRLATQGGGGRRKRNPLRQKRGRYPKSVAAALPVELGS